MAKKLETGKKPPAWWCDPECDIRVSNEDSFYISISHAQVKIKPEVAGTKVLFLLTWRTEEVEGKFHATRAVIESAFGLKDITDESDRWMLERYTATSAKHGEFIRKDLYLNIPGPGTGRKGYPTVSILLNDEMKEAIDALLNT